MVIAVHVKQGTVPYPPDHLLSPARQAQVETRGGWLEGGIHGPPGAMGLPPMGGLDMGTGHSSMGTHRTAAGLGIAPGLIAPLTSRPAASSNTYISRYLVVSNTIRNPSCSHVYQHAIATS